ncbi:TPA: hypothetical protein L7053_003417 [Klebsiella pneumoniae]|uniref:hypothetical protein n=1 Tax=Klebsiella pneumoniae TaxID=573 RepID=UPI00124B7294|nr:hypothetical protein [Klebsiella pneumoniae]EKX1867871.1 hypothetical protein [Klebsiella pneumoniae]KAB1794021.1 hypothetical protein FXO02_03210 [Klebsiella pneumoniae]MBV7382516.1 hypothetical protein [Klebsiella pneumoniae]HBQ4072460.1 hypothetical protein [Klebsiella pneumoniae]HBR3313455.1 hypothetical protein [Klebsiella pneumoniae]
MATYENTTAVGCDVGFSLPKDSESHFINSRAEACKTGFLEYGSEEEFTKLLAILNDNRSDFEALLKEIKSNPLPEEEKKERIQNSKIFEYLSAAANASAVYQFLASLFNN